jgi:tripartite-type tricarboxylate transporter receptor subunit TctC
MFGKIIFTGTSLMLILLFAITAGSVKAQEFPSKPIEVIVGFAPGGGTDMIARAVADVAHKYVGQPLVVINKTGATGTIAAQYVASSKPDGYTILVAGGSETVSTPHFKTLSYNAIDDFVPVIRFMIERIGFYVRTDSPWKTMQEFLADAKANPEKYTYAHAGIGGLHHATVQVTEKRTGIRLRHVPYKGGAETLAALVQGGRIRSLAFSSLNRSPVEPNTPNLRDLGIDVYIENQKGFVVPKGTPQPLIQKLHDSLRKVFDDPQFKASAEKLKVELSYLNGEDFRKALKAMYDQVGDSLKK